MNIEKRGNSYRVRQMFDGKSICVSFNHKPTQKEALQALAERIDQAKIRKSDKTFADCAMEFIKSRENVLSPRTVRDYIRYIDRLGTFSDLKITEITEKHVQDKINVLAAGLQPKTVRNYHGFISVILGSFRPDISLHTRLPQKHKIEEYIPTDEDVRLILDEAKTASNGVYYIPLALACYGLRRSEVCALDPSDIKGNVVHIHKAIVQNNDGEWVQKTTKTTSSTRDVEISQELADMIHQEGAVYDGHPSNLNAFLSRTQKKLGLEHFSLHKFRHYFCSKLISMNIDIKTIQYLGGWETDTVPRQVYAHVMADKLEESRRTAAKGISNALNI